MNILLWVVQIVLAYLCIAGGSYQIFKINELQKVAASMRALPSVLWALFGSISIICGLGLLIPGATKVAAAVVVVESLLISALYIYYGDFPPLMYSLAMIIIAAFIFYGRSVLKP